MRVTGWQAIEAAEQTGATLGKYADPIEGAREGLTVEQAREVAREDPALVYLDVPASEVEYYGTQEETIVKVAGRFFVVQSPDLVGREFEELKGLPEGAAKLNPRDCADLEIPAALGVVTEG